MPNSSTQTNFSFFGFLVREGTAFIFTGLIWYAIWGGYAPKLDMPEAAFGAALMMGIIALVYVGIQAIAVAVSSLGRVSRYMLDLLVSLVPLALVSYATALSMSGHLPLTFYQWGVLLLGGIACFIDVVIFTWFNMKVNKLANRVVLVR